MIRTILAVLGYSAGLTLIGCGIAFAIVPMIIGGVVFLAAGSIVAFFPRPGP
jgi:hypothetical protein